jgi:tetratricopeptide (TPR) repeat protein
VTARVIKPPDPIPAEIGKSVSAPATEALIKSARAAVASESYDAALEYLREAVRKDPRSADALWELAQLYEKHLQYPKDAARTYKKFRELFPNDPRAIARNPAAAAAPAGKPRDTRKAMDLWGKGFARQRQGDVDGSIDLYKSALEADDSLVSAWYNLGLAYRARNELPAAETAFAKAAALSSTMTEAHYMLGWVCYKQRNKAKAAESLNRALAINPNYANAHCLLGFICREDKQIKTARQHLERYLQLTPADDPTAREVKAWLDQAPRT